AHWGYPDPSQVQGTDDDKRQAFKEVMVGLRKRLDILAALPLERLDAMSIQAELKRIASAK
ncbi:MAG: arsenate reductase ArsC, partial [Polynucleobacter victoriensis]